MFTSNIVSTDVFIATKQLLTLMNVNINIRSLSELVSNSKDFPSLASIENILEVLRIKNMAVALKEENLEQIPLPAIAHLTVEDGIFVTISKVENNKVEWYHYKNGWQNESILDFSKKWSGIALLVDSDTTLYAQKQFADKHNMFKRNSNIIFSSALILIICTYLGLFHPFLSQNWNVLLVFFFNLIGLSICFFAASWVHIKENISNIRQERNLNMTFIKRIYFNMEEIGVYYFFSGFLLATINIYKGFLDFHVLMFLFSIVFIFSILFIRYFTTFNKKFKIAALIILYSTAILYYFQSKHTFFTSSMSSLIYFLLALTIAHLVKSTFENSKVISKNIKKYATLLENVKKNQNYLTEITNTKNLFPPIFKGMKVLEIGDSNATNTITLFGDPSDNLFIQAYEDVINLIKRNESIKTQIILMGVNHNSRNVNKFIKILLSLPMEEQQLVLEDFLKLKGKNIASWMKQKYANITISEESNKIFNLYKSWFEISEKKEIPILLLNGVEMSTLYQVSDIEFIIENIETDA